jgi:hypothetical protein
VRGGRSCGGRLWSRCFVGGRRGQQRHPDDHTRPRPPPGTPPPPPHPPPCLSSLSLGVHLPRRQRLCKLVNKQLHGPCCRGSPGCDADVSVTTDPRQGPATGGVHVAHPTTMRPAWCARTGTRWTALRKTDSATRFVGCFRDSCLRALGPLGNRISPGPGSRDRKSLAPGLLFGSASTGNGGYHTVGLQRHYSGGPTRVRGHRAMVGRCVPCPPPPRPPDPPPLRFAPTQVAWGAGLATPALRMHSGSRHGQPCARHGPRWRRRWDGAAARGRAGAAAR